MEPYSLIPLAYYRSLADDEKSRTDNPFDFDFESANLVRLNELPESVWKKVDKEKEEVMESKKPDPDGWHIKFMYA